MTISMYAASIPPMIRSLTNLKVIIEKAVTHAEAKKIDTSVLINARLYPDMFPLVRQVQIATDVAKGAASRLAGLKPPKYEDNESSVTLSFTISAESSQPFVKSTKNTLCHI